MKPNPILAFIIVFVRIFIFLKITTLLILTSMFPEKYQTSELTWWVYFLIFDIWILSMIPSAEEIKKSQEEEEEEIE